MSRNWTIRSYHAHLIFVETVKDAASTDSDTFQLCQPQERALGPPFPQPRATAAAGLPASAGAKGCEQAHSGI